MEAKYKITAGQFFLMLFVSQAVLTAGMNCGALGGENMLEGAVSCLLSMAVGAALSWPLWALKQPIAITGRVKAVPALYLFYFGAAGGRSLGLFQIFLQDTADPEFSTALVMLAVLAAAVYGALRGIETVARCAVCVFALMLAGSGLILAIVGRRFDPENLEPLYRNGLSQTVQGGTVFLSRTSAFAEMAVLLPLVNGNRRRGFWAWAGGTSLYFLLTLALLAGCLGPYAATQNFPVFSLSAITEIRSLQRLDAVFVGLWIMGLIVRLACQLYACRVCAAALAGRPAPKAAVLLAGAAMLLTALAMTAFHPVQRVLLSGTGPLLWAMLLTGSVLPLWMMLLQRRRDRRR